MSTGVIGGIIGGKFSKHIESQYGKSRSYFWSGILCLLISLFSLIIFLSEETTTVSNYDKLRIESFSVSERKSTRNYEIILNDNQQAYSLGYSIWKDRYDPEIMLRSLDQSKFAILWLKKGSSSFKTVRGIQTELVEINPQIGVQIDNQNRLAIMWISLGFLLMGSVAGIYSIKLNRTQ